MASDAAGIRPPFLGCGVRVASPAARGGACRSSREVAGSGSGRDALRCAPLRVGPPARRALRPCGAKDYGKSSDEAEGEGGSGSYRTSAKRGKDGKAKSTVPDFEEGVKEWVGTWWPQAIDASSKTGREFGEYSQNLCEWAYNLMERFGSGVEDLTSEVRNAVGDVKGEMEAVMGVKKPKPAKPAMAPKEEKKGALSFLGSMPIVKTYFGRKDETEGSPKGAKRVTAKKQVKKPVVSVKKAERRTTGQAKAKGTGGPLQGLVNMGRKAETDKGTNGAKPAKVDSDQKNTAQIPILKSFFGDPGPPATDKGKETMPKQEAPKKVSTPKPAPPKPEPVVAEKKPDLAKQEAFQPPAMKPVATITKKETPPKQVDESGPDATSPATPTLPPPLPPPPSPVVVPKTDAATAAPPATKVPTAQVYEKLVKESVGTPAGLGKGLNDKAPKSSGGAVGGPYNLGPKDDSQKSRTPVKSLQTPQASTGGGGSIGSYGGNGGGGYGGGDGSSGGAAGDEPEHKNPLLLLLAIFIVAGGSLALWYSKGQSKAKAQPSPKDCAS